MKKTYDDILFDEYGNSIPLSTDDFIEYLFRSTRMMSRERDELKKQLDDIRLILDSNKETAII